MLFHALTLSNQFLDDQKRPCLITSEKGRSHRGPGWSGRRDPVPFMGSRKMMSRHFRVYRFFDKAPGCRKDGISVRISDSHVGRGSTDPNRAFIEKRRPTILWPLPQGLVRAPGREKKVVRSIQTGLFMGLRNFTVCCQKGSTDGRKEWPDSPGKSLLNDQRVRDKEVLPSRHWLDGKNHIFVESEKECGRYEEKC